jgi:hypothetical protein
MNRRGLRIAHLELHFSDQCLAVCCSSHHHTSRRRLIRGCFYAVLRLCRRWSRADLDMASGDHAGELARLCLATRETHLLERLSAHRRLS